MRELFGIWLIFTGLIIGCIALIGMDMELKDQIKVGLSLELVLTLITIGGYLLS